MKKVLIAMDYEPSAEKIAQTGHKIATALGASTILLHVVADAGYYSNMAYSPIMGFTGFVYPGIDEMLVKDLLEQSHNYLERSKEHLGDPNIATLVKEGDFVDTILETAAELGVDLIVMGTHSRRGLDKLLNGSIAESTLKLSKIPLLIIPNDV